MAEIRGDLRDTVEDLEEHVSTCCTHSLAECSRIRMHIREISSFIMDQNPEMRRRLIAVLSGAIREAGK